MSSYPTPSGPTIFATTTYSYAAQSVTCPDGALIKPHAVTSAGGDTYCYDKNGNMVKRVEGGTTYTQTFDAENRLSSVTVSGVTTNFIYDGDGNLVKKVKGTTATVYVGTYEVELNSGVVTKKTSYYMGGAMRVDIVGGSNDVYYTFKDHPSTSLRTSLSSASTLLDASGNLVTNGGKNLRSLKKAASSSSLTSPSPPQISQIQPIHKRRIHLIKRPRRAQELAAKAALEAVDAPQAVVASLELRF